MKTKAFLISLAVFLFALILIVSVSLRKKAGDSEDVSYSTESSVGILDTIVYDDVISEPIYDNMPDGVYYKKITKRTVLNTENGSRIVYNYPSFEGFEGLNTDNDINSLIVSYIKKKQKSSAEGFYKLIESGAKAVYEISDFEITYADFSLISIVFDGYYDINDENSHIDTGASSVKYSLNIDIANMKILTSEQLISSFTSLKSRFVGGDMLFESGAEELLDIASLDDLFFQYKAEYEIYPDIYFTEDNVKIIILLTSDLGGDAVFSDNINEAREYIYADMPALSSLFS